MFYQTMKLVIVAAALAVCGNVSAQGCADCNVNAQTNNCGRGITQGEAAGLWAGYCQEDCGYYGETSDCSGGYVDSCGGSGYADSCGCGCGAKGGLLSGLRSKQGGCGCGGGNCLLYTSPSPRDLSTSRMPSSA